MPSSDTQHVQEQDRRTEKPRNDSISSVTSANRTGLPRSISENGNGPPVPAAPDPPDGGWGWMIVLGAIVTGALVPSLFMCFGVFMNAFLTVFPNTSKSAASWIPSIMNALMNCMGPITSALVTLYSARTVALIGGLILSLGLVLTFFTSSISALYFTYGLLGGIGGGLALAPGLYLISQYFRKRRGMATGICMAGSSIGQIVLPYTIQALLDEYGYRGCILVLGGLTLNICVSAALFRPLQVLKAPAPKPKRVRTLSQTSKRSLTFIPDEGIDVITSNGKCNHTKPKKKKKKKSTNNNNKKNTGKQVRKNKDYQIQAMEKNWQSIKSADSNTPSPPRSRSRTLSLDSSRILPGIPEEHEEEKYAEGDSDSDHDVNKQEQEPMLPETGNANQVISETSFKNAVNLANNGKSDINDKNGLAVPITQAAPQCNNVQRSDSITLSLTDVDSYFGTSSDQRCNKDTPEVISLHHFCGSVASITSIGTSIKDEPPRHVNIFVQIYRSMGFEFFREGIFHILTMSFALMIVSLSNFAMFVPTYGITINLTRDEAAGLISFIAIASMFGRLLLPSLSDVIKTSKKHLYSGCCFITMCSIILACFAQNYTILLVSLVLFGFSSGGSIAISINVFLDYIPLERFTAFFGLVQLVVGIIVLFATPTMGLLVDATGSYLPTFFTLAVGSFISASLLYLDRFVPPVKPAAAVVL